VFIVGALRSGTTLLRLMIDHHPEICVFGEFEYAVRWIEDGRLPALSRYYRKLGMDRVFRAHGLTIDPELDYRRLVQGFLREASAPSGKPIVGGAIHSNFHELPSLFPGARFIHLLRDPRDVSRSCIGMGWVGHSYFGTQYWLEPVKRWKALEPSLEPHQKHVLKYEDLIGDPVGELTKICEFLAVPFDPAMLEYPKDSTYSAPDPSLVNQWRRKLSDEEVTWIESQCAPLMKEVGYEPVNLAPRSPTTVETLRLSLENRAKRMRRNVDRYGLPLYVSWQVTKRVPSGPLERWVLRKVQSVDIARLK